MNQNEPKRSNTTHNHVHKQTDFENPFINGRGFIYLCILKMSFTFYVFTVYYFMYFNFYVFMSSRQRINRGS